MSSIYSEVANQIQLGTGDLRKKEIQLNEDSIAIIVGLSN